jgi:hypothetical protein
MSKALRIPHIRVDTYAGVDGVFVGELTQVPGPNYGGGVFKIKPKLDAQLGKAWLDAANRLGVPMPSIPDWPVKQLKPIGWGSQERIPQTRRTK